MATLLLATLSLVFRFIVPLKEKALTAFATVCQLAFAAYFISNNAWFWAAFWLVLAYREFRKLPRSTGANLLVVNAILLYGLGTMWLLDSMGLSKIYMNPFVLLAVVLLVVVSLVWWTIVDSKRLDAASTQNH